MKYSNPFLSHDFLDRKLADYFSTEGKSDLGFDIDNLFWINNLSKASTKLGINLVDNSLTSILLDATIPSFSLDIKPTVDYLSYIDSFWSSEYQFNFAHDFEYLGKDLETDDLIIKEVKTGEEKLKNFVSDIYKSSILFFEDIECEINESRQSLSEFFYGEIATLLKDEDVYKFIVKKLKKRYKELRKCYINRFSKKIIQNDFRTDFVFKFEYIDLTTNDKKDESLRSNNFLKSFNRAKKLNGSKTFLKNEYKNKFNKVSRAA